VASGQTLYGLDFASAFVTPLRASRLHRLSDRGWSLMPQPAASESLSGAIFAAQDTLQFFGAPSPAIYREIFVWNGVDWRQKGNRQYADAIFQGTPISIDLPQADGTRVIQRLVGETMQPFLRVPPLRMAGRDRDQYLQLTLGEFRGMPVLAGTFDEMVGVGPVGGIAIFYDNAWHALGNPGLADPEAAAVGFTTAVNLVEWRGDLYASNGFSLADGQNASGIARFDGARWHAVGGGIQNTDIPTGRPSVNMIIYQDKLYAYGNFDRAGGKPAHHVAEWDGMAWRTLGPEHAPGFDPDAFAGVSNAVVANGNLIFAGEIHEAGGMAVDFMATWRVNGLLFTDGFE
jgi:hypothetical protein